MKVAMMRYEMSRVKPILLLFGFFEREGAGFLAALAVLVVVFGLAVGNLEAPE